MASKVFIKTYTGAEEEIATCQFGDDAELIFNQYKSINSYVRVEFCGAFGKATVLEYHPK
jgi:hypothetical protein